MLDQIEITLRNKENEELPLYIDITDGPLQRKWLSAFNHLVKNDYHLEKNYHFMGFEERDRQYLCDQINQAIKAVNDYSPVWSKTYKLSPYYINEVFTIENTSLPGEIGEDLPGGTLVHDKTNWLHRWFEELQGISLKAGDKDNMSKYYLTADHKTKWWIRQLNLLCHEYESAVLSHRKRSYVPEWAQYSELFCFLNAPRFDLNPNTDYELFGIETLQKELGGVYMGVNKAVGKHHYEVFLDEAGSDINHLTTVALRAQCQGAGDMDINWSNSLKGMPFMTEELANFRTWLIKNNFDPDDKALTIGHPKIGQVDLMKSFNSEDHAQINKILINYLDVYKIKTSDNAMTLEYRWDDPDYTEQQIHVLAPGYDYVSKAA